MSEIPLWLERAATCSAKHHEIAQANDAKIMAWLDKRGLTGADGYTGVTDTFIDSVQLTNNPGVFLAVLREVLEEKDG